MRAAPAIRARSRAAGAGRAGERTTSSRPAPGWKGSATAWSNPRAPSVPATLHLTLEEYFAAGALVGLLASQADEPDQAWVCHWSTRMGRAMAREARKLRKRR